MGIPAFQRQIRWHLVDVRCLEIVECVLENFSMSVKIKEDEEKFWRFTGVYCAFHYKEGKEFWEELASLYRLCYPKGV